MDRITLYVKSRENLRMLKEELQKRYTILEDDKPLVDSNFDLCIIDGMSLDELSEDILFKRKIEEPLFLPFLLLTTRKDVKYVTRHLWKTVDEIILMPIEKVELHARVEVLLRARRLSMQLKHRLEELETFSHAIGHDLKAPLRSIIGFSSIIKEDYGSKLDEECREYVERIHRAGKRLEELFDALRTFLAAGSKGMKRQRLIFRQIVDSVLNDFMEEVRKKNAQVTIEGDLELDADKTLLTLTLKNLIENALLYTKPDRPPQIRISAKKKNQHVVVEVSDNGIGIPEKDLNRIFDLFVRLCNPEQYPGTGLGLSIVKKCVELMEGTVGVHSKEHQGSTFWIELPIKEG